VRLGVTNPEPTRGGGIAEVAAVTQEDYERLRAALLQQLQQRAYAEMNTPEWIGATEFIAVESLAVVLVLDESYSEYIGAAAESVSLDMRVVVQGVVVDEQYARQVVYSALDGRVDAGAHLLAESLVFSRGEELGVDDARRVTFLMTCTGDMAPTIDPDTVRQQVTGRALTDAVATLERAYPLVHPPDVALWPDWFGRMPTLVFRVNVDVAYVP
jgi:hypothetical protein